MKLIVLLAAIALFQLSATESYAQNTKITLSLKNSTLIEAIKQIEKQTDFVFFYNNAEVDLNKTVNIQINNGNIKEFLNKELAGYNYRIENNKIVLTPNVTQQNTKIKGKVTDSSGVPIIGANVTESGTSNGTITDVDGAFTLDVKAGAQLKISYIGYLSKMVLVDNKTSFSIQLSEDTQTLDEVVVVGYGTVRKADLSGSISVLDGKSFKDQPITQVTDAIQGRMSGVQVENSSVPGGSVKIRVRGSNSINRSNEPLYVVDGIVRESGLNGINSDDIQSIQVLKDASSTAIYGSRGSNGVVLVTTKTGNSNQRIISFDAQLSSATVYKTYNILSPFEYATAYREIKNPNAFTDDQMNAYKNGTAGIDWQDEIFRTGTTQNYKLAISNGNKDAQYYISANYMGQDGIVDYSSNKRYQVRANITSDLTKWLHVTADVNASHSIRKGSSYEASKSNPLWIALNYSPTMEMMDDKGNYNKDIYNSIASNPKGIIALNGNENITDVVNGMVDMRFTILPGLTFTTTNGLDYNDAKGYSFSSAKVETKSSMGNNDSYRMMLQSSNNVTYTGKWGNHALTATGVYEVTSTEGRSMSLNGTNLLTESVGWWDVNMASTHTFNNDYYKWSLMSGVGRVMYNYNDKYLVTGTLRADGSSKFTNKKWGYFPSVAVAWSLGNEEFMKSQKLFQDVKIRVSYGIVGNQAINPYETLGLLAQTSYSFGGTTNYTGYWSNTLATPDLTWEKTKQFDLGLDFSMLDRRLNVSADYFYKKTVDGLLQKQIPKYDGGGTYWVNAGEISNKGIDLSLTAHILQNKDFKWTSSINGTYLKNRVESLAGDEFLYGTSPASGMVEEVTIIKPGYSIGSFYGYQWQGLDNKGDNIYADLNDNGEFDSGDRTIIGKSTPDFTIGWNNQFTWRNWDLNLFFNGSFGAKKLNLVRFTMASMVGDSRFITLRESYMNNFDRNKSQSAEYPSLLSSSSNYQPASTQWLESADYVRLENISLSYNLSKEITKFADLRLTLSCQNLITLTGYKGFDPASSSFSSSNVDINSGIDMGAYPSPRTVTFGVKMNF
ncbi:TonB-dependent receptor [Macellibacteroides fermentans]|uniref:TonB-dependent receptor n=1 Tax=Macellibacteroides fermentans TaxID=879969 RepID=UPI00406CDC3E